MNAMNQWHCNYAVVAMPDIVMEMIAVVTQVMLVLLLLLRRLVLLLVLLLLLLLLLFSSVAVVLLLGCSSSERTRSWARVRAVAWYWGLSMLLTVCLLDLLHVGCKYRTSLLSRHV